jgi:hypothetical protein
MIHYFSNSSAVEVVKFPCLNRNCDSLKNLLVQNNHKPVNAEVFQMFY